MKMIYDMQTWIAEDINFLKDSVETDQSWRKPDLHVSMYAFELGFECFCKGA